MSPVGGALLAARWSAAVVGLGGRPGAAARTGQALVAQYARPPRAYHSAAHACTVAARADELADDVGMDAQLRAVLALAALGHDVVYDGVPGADERASAAWLVEHLDACGVADAVRAEVARLVEGTAGHLAAAGDLLAQCLYDADLAVLGADPDAYDAYAAQVREEYRTYDDEAWRVGRTAVLRDLLARDALYALPGGRERWQARARQNLARELWLLSAD